MKKFIASSMQSGSQPLPILNRIDEKKALRLVEYKFGEANAASFVDAMNTLVPEKLKKLTLISNAISDKSIAEIFKRLTENEDGGLTSIAILNNDIGRETLRALEQFYLDAPMNK